VANTVIAEAADRLELLGSFVIKTRFEARKHGRLESFNDKSYFEDTVSRCNDVLKP